MVAKLFDSIVLVLLIFNTNVLFAQIKNEPNQNQKHWDKGFEWNWIKGSHPFVETNYGYGLPRQKLFEGEFANYGSVEVKLGYSRIKKIRGFILDLDEHFVFGGFSSFNLNEFDNEVSAEVKTEMTRFGVANRLGYGYKLKFLSFLPYSQTQFSFVRLESERPADIFQQDNNILDRYEASYRLGNAMDGGIKVELFESVSIISSYEVAVIYPRVVFFPWLGGLIVREFSLGAISHFAEDIVSSSNLLGPLMFAVLRNGVAYGLYLGMREKMYWPFNSETPLTYETIKIGMSITF
jgi:hypothetical protein